MNQEDKDTSPHVKMPELQLSPETEWYLKNTSYLQLVEKLETANHLLEESVKQLISFQEDEYWEGTQKVINKIKQFLNKRK